MFCVLQVAIKNSVDVFYFATVMPMHIFFTEDGAMEKRVFLSTWKDIPSQNEVQFNIDNINMNGGMWWSTSNLLCYSGCDCLPQNK